ncbi:MAG: hemophore-related protein [Mycobacterium sp.]|uniref:hemophore-related protein n=1 Tax=Mycobacterium sp. TaxID=1785 RepID=UPI003F966192
MVTLSSTRFAAAVCGLALSLTAGVGVASAAPDLSPANTTCNYSQVVAAMNAQFPDAAAQFNASAQAQSWLHGFLDSPPDHRQEMLQQMPSIPEAAPFGGIVVPLANTCHNY